jgi:xanthine dehydrogenase iron-sulfur cluster and FAD-binding subunit A
MQDFFSLDKAADANENWTHSVLGCKCQGDGANIDASKDYKQLPKAEELDPSTSDEFSLWQHFSAPHVAQLLKVTTEKKTVFLGLKLGKYLISGPQSQHSTVEEYFICVQQGPIIIV